MPTSAAPSGSQGQVTSTQSLAGFLSRRLCRGAHPTAFAHADPVRVGPLSWTTNTLAVPTPSVAATAHSSVAGKADSSVAGTATSRRLAQGGRGRGFFRSTNIFNASGKSLSCWIYTLSCELLAPPFRVNRVFRGYNFVPFGPSGFSFEYFSLSRRALRQGSMFKSLRQKKLMAEATFDRGKRVL